MAVLQVKVAAFTFVVYLSFTIVLLRDFQLQDVTSVLYKFLGALTILLISFTVPQQGVVRRSGLLGFVHGTGLLFSFASYYSKWRYFGWYLSTLSFFHFSEYVMTALYNPGKLSTDSFLLNHSLEYKLAAVLSWAEFLLELWFFPLLKSQLLVSFIGLMLVIFGESFRKAAMMTAKSNFTHLVQFRKRDGHILVTGGVYGWCRHPAYVGWFWWSIGTQLILCNPICFVGYTIASWKFFKERIWDEEMSLLEFFGQNYVNYQKKVGTGLPFIKGFKVDK